MNFLWSLVLVFWGLSVQASSSWREQSTLVTPDSDMQRLIDEVTVEIFHSPLQEMWCNTYGNEVSVFHSLGVSEKAAIEAFSGCKERKGHLTKPMSKQYYLSFESMPALDSWTDLGNRTYLFVSEGLNRERLKSMILHEMAISVDAKTNMLYTSYLIYQRNQSGDSRGAIYHAPSQLSAQQQLLQNAFNQAAWQPISLSFAALRAFSIEQKAHGQNVQISHDECVDSFKSLYQVTRQIPSAPIDSESLELDQLSEMLAGMISRNMAPQSEEQETEVLQQLLSENLTLKNLNNKEVTFCQFMAEPLLSGKSTYNFYGSGPRPRTTGGSGGQGGSPLMLQQQQWLQKSHQPDMSTQRAVEQLRERLIRNKRLNLQQDLLQERK
ncbi:MAG: hypothetical protein AAGB31_06705 [Bdellovibrio sp.]